MRSAGNCIFLLYQASDAITRARLLAVSRKESGAWLHAVPKSSLGLRMDNDTIRVAVGLRLGEALCSPHSCQSGLHGLSSRFSNGRHYHHAALKEIIHQALTTSHIPSRSEPTGLDRSDGKRPGLMAVASLVPRPCFIKITGVLLP